MPGSEPRVVLFGRFGCHLCEAARAVVAETCRAGGVGFDEVDVDGDAALAHRYGDHVPVVTVDDAVVDFWRIDPDRLSAALSAGRAP